MTLSDTDILELNDLCNALVDETITEQQQARLSHWLATSEEARELYVRTMGLSASLHYHAAEMLMGEPDEAHAIAPERATASTRSWWMVGVIAAAACVGLVAWMSWPDAETQGGSSPIAKVVPPTTLPAIPAGQDNEFVAQLTGSKESAWAAGDSPLSLGGRLRKGQQVELATGFAEITFDSGARVVLQGPASFKVDSQWSATLTRGTLKANVPPQAAGFRISNPAVEVVDLGTEFSMVIDEDAAEVLVLKGEVEAAPRGTPDQQPILLREMEARRFAATGVSSVDDSEQKFRRLNQPVLLEHFIAPTGFAHWSFDETAGGQSLLPTVSGMALTPDAARMELAPRVPLATALTAGQRGNALSFDGRRYAMAAFPGMSATSPHTVVFWVKIPPDANLSNAYAMVAWGAINKNFGTHPFHISWNRNPSEGTIGALRTDYGKGYALGATPLRDGRWHHIAVVFVPREDPERPIEVKQYVDGRLEGEGRPSSPGSDIFMNPNYASSKTSGTIWLGCRLGTKDVRNERFHGELDELFIADRALQPQEVVRLMNANRLE
jgi:ferric-dicitrate binding protein FerR (iron transport regulator)